MPEGAPGLLATLLDAAGDNCAGDAPIVHAPSKLWFLVLYRDHAKAISRYLQHRYGSGPPEPDDITHEAFAKLAALDEAERQTLENPKAFLYRIAENLLISAKRKARVASAHAADENYRERRSEVTPERVIAAKNDLEVVERAIRAMPEARRRCFIMNRYEELSYAEIARRSGMSETGVRGHVERALRDISKALEEPTSRWRK